METEEIVNYVINTPGTTNPNVLRGMVEEVAGSGLPEVTPEDVGKTLLVSDEGEWELGDFPKELPEITDNDTGCIPIVGAGLKWSMASALRMSDIPSELSTQLTSSITAALTSVVAANGAYRFIPDAATLDRDNAVDKDAYGAFVDSIYEVSIGYRNLTAYDNGGNIITYREYHNIRKECVIRYNYILTVPNVGHFSVSPWITANLTPGSENVTIHAYAAYLPIFS